MTAAPYAEDGFRYLYEDEGALSLAGAFIPEDPEYPWLASVPEDPAGTDRVDGVGGTVGQENPGDLSRVGTVELLALTTRLITELAARTADARFTETVPRVRGRGDRTAEQDWGLYSGALTEATEDSDAEPGSVSDSAAVAADGPAEDAVGTPSDVRVDLSLPDLVTAVESVGRMVDRVRTVLAGHVDRVFAHDGDRVELLGIPPGKCAHRNGTGYLQDRLLISRRQARQRVRIAGQTMGVVGVDRIHTTPPAFSVLTDLAQSGGVDVEVVDTIAQTLTEARRVGSMAQLPPVVVDGLIGDGEAGLVAQAHDVDPSGMGRVCARWRQYFDAAVNPDGAEPTDGQLAAQQGMFYRGRTRGLHRWLVAADDAQHEVLATLAGAATNPRTQQRAVAPGSGVGEAEPGQGVRGAPGTAVIDGSPGTGPDGGFNSLNGARVPETVDADGDPAEVADRRSRGQRQLDGLIAALGGALALAESEGVASHGGARPQVLVTIDYQSLAGQIRTPRDSAPGSGGSPLGGVDPAPVDSEAAYSGPIDPGIIRRLACDAELIPAVLGGEGQVLDVGRAQRVFSRRLRQAVTARDGGCAAPGCSIPAPWCEVHHVQHWEHGGPTSVDNGVLLCSHHHHAVHAGAWEIMVRDGVPWFIPARYVDPDRRPRRNGYWRGRGSAS